MDPGQSGRTGIATNGKLLAQFQRNGYAGNAHACRVLESTPDDSSPASKDTEAVLESMGYVGGMNYAKFRLESSRAKTAGKQKKARPPTLRVQEELARDGTSSCRDGTTSSTSSRRSSAYRAVEEAAEARTAMLQAEAEAKRALARLADTRAECAEQHQAIAAELEAMRCSVKGSLRAASQQRTLEAAKVDAMGYRIEEMKDMFLQRELRLETQMAELGDQVQTALSAATRPTTSTRKQQPETTEPIASTSKTVPMRTQDPLVTIKASPKTEPRISKLPPAGKKTNRVHVCAPNSLSSAPLPPLLSFTRTQDQAVDPMTTTLSTIELTDTKATAWSRVGSTDEEGYTTARTETAGLTSMFLTASEGIPTGDPCASSTRKKTDVNGELSMQATRGSRDNSPAPSEEEEAISREQLRFTAAISKAMSKELAPLLAGRDPTQARPFIVARKRVPLMAGS